MELRLQLRRGIDPRRAFGSCRPGRSIVRDISSIRPAACWTRRRVALMMEMIH